MKPQRGSSGSPEPQNQNQNWKNGGVTWRSPGGHLLTAGGSSSCSPNGTRMKLQVKQQFGAKRLILSCHVSLTSSCCGLAQQEVLHFSLRRTDRTASAAAEMNADEMNGNEMNGAAPPLLLCLFLSCSCQTVSCHGESNRTGLRNTVCLLLSHQRVRMSRTAGSILSGPGSGCDGPKPSRPSSLVVSPNQPQFYEYGSVSLSCEQFGPDRWTVWRQTNSGIVLHDEWTFVWKLKPEENVRRVFRLQVFPCSEWGSQTSSTCTISTLKTSDSGVYWCESRHRDSSHIVIITVTSKSQRQMLTRPGQTVSENDESISRTQKVLLFSLKQIY
ncbi:hypothetical protein CCH79_00019715 [Gambusia affinis]|uniref:Ig-like domain-containing protein n=1 Tax=Gambusia affinis TaxID=33528 RepID=A0A315V8Z1_GAMAF|nr:hypothetical protein CCH79_00019715 [Gambusia affinis]